MRLLAEELASRPGAVARADPTLQFGERGLTGGDYFYYLTMNPLRARDASGSTPEGRCEADLVQVGPASATGMDELSAPLLRPRFGETEIRLVDRCDGALVAAVTAASNTATGDGGGTP
jgi:hypothetical protein